MNNEVHYNPQKKCCPKKRSHSCAKTAFVAGIMIGGVYGMLFAKTAGKELRTKLKKSKTPMVDFIEAGAEMDLEFVKFIREKVVKYLND
jgi:hypothetical protein